MSRQGGLITIFLSPHYPHPIGRLEWIQRHQEPWVRTRGHGQGRRRTCGHRAAQMPPGCQPAETMDSRHLAGQRWLRVSSRLFERVHVQVQQKKLEISWPAFLQVGGVGGCHRPQPSVYDHSAAQPGGWLSLLHMSRHKMWGWLSQLHTQ